MPNTIEELRKILGDHEGYSFRSQHVTLLREWAVLKGVPAPAAAVMADQELTAFYHNAGNESKIAAMNALFLQIMSSVTVPGFNVEMTRRAVADFIGSPEMLPIYEAAAKSVYDRLPPVRIEFATPTNTFVPTGMVHNMTQTVALIANIGHAIMMVGPAGCGKTTIGETVAKILGFPFYITSTINDTHELTGFVDGHGAYHATPFRQAFEGGGVWIADEIDAWDASALLAANSALANGFMTFPDRPVPIYRHANFRMIATANTFGKGADRVYIGRNELDAASLDRFAVINVDYDLELERMFSNGNNIWLQIVWDVRQKVEKKRIRHVVSSRAIGMGATALAAGLSMAQTMETYLLKGMSQSDREKLE